MNNWNTKCSFCGEEIAYGARRCPYCGSLLGESVNKSASVTNAQPDNTPAVNAQPSSQTDLAKEEYVQNVYNGETAVGETGTHFSSYDEITDANNSVVTNNNADTDNNMDARPYAGDPYRFQNDLKSDDTDYRPLGNGMKVFLTALSTFPWIGQIIGVIAAIIYMNSEYDPDRKSFGSALMVSSIIFFIVDSCLGCFIAMGLSVLQG